MITRYALGPHIILIGRESVKQRLKNSFSCQICFFYLEEEQKNLGKRQRFSFFFFKATEKQQMCLFRWCGNPPHMAMVSRCHWDRKCVLSSWLCCPLASALLTHQAVLIWNGLRQAGSRPWPLKGQAASQTAALKLIPDDTDPETNSGLWHI